MAREQAIRRWRLPASALALVVAAAPTLGGCVDPDRAKVPTGPDQTINLPTFTISTFNFDDINPGYEPTESTNKAFGN